MDFLAPARSKDDRIKGKARSLALLADRGLAVPTAIVTLDSLFRALCSRTDWPIRLDEGGFAVLAESEHLVRETAFPNGFEEALRSMLAGLGETSFSVRSSFVGEDEVGHLAAGVYESRVDVPPALVGMAIREILCSAIAPAATAYGLSRGLSPAIGPLCVLIHPYLRGEAEGTVALADGEPLLECRRGLLSTEIEQDLFSALRAFVMDHGPTEMEWVVDNGRLFFLQARPFEIPRAPKVFAGFSALSPSDPSPLAWTWDAAHNPLPLSPAQQGLVALVNESCRIGIRQRVLGGYLFYVKDDRPMPPAIAPGEAAVALANLKADFEHRRCELPCPPSLEAALALFLSIYEPLFGVIQPAVKRRRVDLVEFLLSRAPGTVHRLADLLRDVPSVATERRRLAGLIARAGTESERALATTAYQNRFGDESPSWDVVEPTYSEGLADRVFVPALECTFPAHALAREMAQTLAPEDRHRFLSLVEQAREGVALSEEDDWVYARAQAYVRLALLGLGKSLVERGELDLPGDVFFLPLFESRRMAGGEPIPGDLREVSAQARSLFEQAKENPPDVCPGCDGVARGVGVGGKVVGRVCLHSSLRPGRPTKSDVLVARTLLPTELPLLQAAALVVDTGGVLDHVASQARERNLPAVVGAAGASTLFEEGDLVLVDGDRGLVIRLACAD